MWREVLKDFWVPFEQLVSETSGISITEVIDALDPLMATQLFPPQVLHGLHRPGYCVLLMMNFRYQPLTIAPRCCLMYGADGACIERDLRAARCEL